MTQDPHPRLVGRQAECEVRIEFLAFQRGSKFCGPRVDQVQTDPCGATVCHFARRSDNLG